jgi:hypothetical protein
MIEALRKRLEEISRGQVADFNSDMASAAINNTGEEQPAAGLEPTQVNGLRPLQSEAVSKALSNTIFYLWGPPGTGKTFTLSKISVLLFETGKKILICSNTNQAVDQVLYALCRALKPQHPAMEAGQIVRIGKIALDDLSRSYSEYVTIDGIIGRKSANLKRRKEELESEIEHIVAARARAQRMLDDFHKVDEISREIDKNISELSDFSLRKNHCEVKIRALQQNIRDLRRKRKVYEDAPVMKRLFIRVFMYKPDAIEADIRQADGKLAQMTLEITELDTQIAGIQRAMPDLKLTMSVRRTALAGIERPAVEQEILTADAKKVSLNREVAKIDAQLTDIQKSTLEKARIVGATVTRLYLSPKMFTNFDTVIIDEASMVLLPALFHAAGLAKEKVIISGDFRQLPPIIKTNEKAISAELGHDVFSHAGITKAVNVGTLPKRTVMLEQQSRMHTQICEMISGPMYGKRLRTADYKPADTLPPVPFETPLTVVDTSTVIPFVSRDSAGSRYNLMHGLAIRNLVFHFQHGGYLTSHKRLGVCSPYTAQAKLLKRLITDLRPEVPVEVGTVHRYQGNEKETMVIDIPDGVGEQRPGRWLDAERPDEEGAKLFNVAISRSQHHLVFFANIDYLDKTLSAQSLLRGMLFYAQKTGHTIDIRDILSYSSIIDDLKYYRRPIELDPETLRTALYDQSGFQKVCIADLWAAKHSILIFSGFTTPQRVRTYESIFRAKIAEGVAIRCVTRPPHDNGTIPYEEGRAALDALETMDCIIDTRQHTHEKIVIIDGEILWFGSLNPLSHTSHTGEVMARLISRDLAQQMAASVAIKYRKEADTYEKLAMVKENPFCGRIGCGRRTYYVPKSRDRAAHWRCEEQTCGWIKGATPKKKQSKLDGTEIIDSRDFITAGHRAHAELLAPSGPRIAFTGGPDCNDHERIWAVLDKVLAKHPDMMLLHGGNPRGAERIAACWADQRSVPQLVFKPDWVRHKDAAPLKRNDRMLEARPVPIGVIVFPGNRISANLADKAEKLGIPIMRFDRPAKAEQDGAAVP